jgi:hypothetical protein
VLQVPVGEQQANFSIVYVIILRGTTVGPPFVKSQAHLVLDQSGELSVTADRVLRLRLFVSVQFATVTRDVTAAV